jgi:RND superfamily putative drug exporter
MDYEVFLVSRMREDFVHHGDPRQAVEHGFVGSARVVTAAAVIMVAVFAAFIPEGDASIQPIAFGLAVGVAIDAFVVRMTFVPAVLALFGAQAWWIPAWLDRILPRFDVEGEGLARQIELAGWPDGAERALALDGMSVGDLDGIDVSVAPGGVLVVRGGSPGERRVLLLALGGRVPGVDGRVKVAGLVLPPRAGAVRRRTSYVRLDRAGDPVADLGAGLRSPASVLMVDGLDALADPQERADVRRVLTDAMDSGPVTLVVACRADADLDDVLPALRDVHTVAVP